MKICAIVRTRNEEANIGRFCQAYNGWVDHVLVADGGSSDKTIEIAREHGAEVGQFGATVEHNGVIRNPEGEHINFLLLWAQQKEADWVIFDDCDCVPNYSLREDGRELIEEAAEEGKNYVYAVRLYLWGEGRHFPHLARPVPPHSRWEPSLWAWSLAAELAPLLDNPWLLAWPPIPPDEVSYLYPSYCLLHRPWPTEAALKRKMKFYNASGKTLLNDPRGWGGPIETLPEWAREETADGC